MSSYVYFFNKIFRPYSNVVFYSMHGRDLNFVDAVRNNEKVFILLGNKNHVSQICSALTEAGLGETEVYIGENLSYPDERISSGRACDFADKENENLSMIYIENKNYENRPYTFGLRDEEFIRGNVPMTKSEVRAISMSKLMLKENSVIYDIGAGTGSVSIECALAAYKGRVFAVEKKAEAVECICKNIEYFHVKNVDVVNGTAPKALKSLPAPTHCFIGGSTGAVKGIIEAVLIKNPCARFVINAISLETMFEAKKAAQEINAEDVEIVNVSISRARAINDLNLMMGLNPVFVISFTGSGVKM